LGRGAETTRVFLAIFIVEIVRVIPLVDAIHVFNPATLHSFILALIRLKFAQLRSEGT